MHVQRIGNWLALAALMAIALLAGCVNKQVTRAYPGPELPREQIAVVRGDAELNVERFDGDVVRSAMRGLGYTGCEIQMLPGMHWVEFGFRHRGNKGTASSTETCTLTFDAAAGATYEIRKTVYVADNRWTARIEDISEQVKSQPQLDAGNAFHRIRDYAKAMEYYRAGAEAGNTAAMVAMGNGYYLGEGVAKDYAEAFRWCLKAAEAGDCDAMCWVGDLYSLGHGVARDDARALEWFQKGAAGGSGGCMVGLGVFYRDGRGGLAKDTEKASYWLRNASLGYDLAPTDAWKAGSP